MDKFHFNILMFSKIQRMECTVFNELKSLINLKSTESQLAEKLNERRTHETAAKVFDALKNYRNRLSSLNSEH
jgi:hypothetical protein